MASFSGAANTVISGVNKVVDFLVGSEEDEKARLNRNYGSGSSNNSDTIKSVFNTGYIPTSKAAIYDVANSGYFIVGTPTDITTKANATTEKNADTSSTLKSVLPSVLADKLSSTLYSSSSKFWQIIITNIAETHEERYSLHNTVSDSIAIFSTGAKPISVVITGFLLITLNDDYNYLFLKRYVDDFRARHLSASNKHLLFVSQDTEFNLIIQNIVMAHSVDMETYVSVTISGIAYNYKMSNSLEPYTYNYYGKRILPESPDKTEVVDGDPEIQKVNTKKEEKAKK